MRRWVLVFSLVVGACTGGQEPPVATTTSPPISATTTTTITATTPLLPTVTTTLPPPGLLAYEKVADLSFPVQVVSRTGDAISYVISKSGVVWGMVDGQILPDPVLDISDRVRDGGEQGLFSLALHPTETSLLYLHYSDLAGNTVVSEFQFHSQTEADPGSERVLLTLDQPAPNHNGGMILFHPDGRLLLGLGDGGGSGDRFGNGQNTATLLGGIVALNVIGDPDPTSFSYGLRNPWRFWIDNGFLYIADVGQNKYEEVSIVPLGPNLNFGWPITEGLHCFRPSDGCDTTGLTLPVVEIEQGDSGTCSVTGGVVYRGAEIPELDGHFLYSDYCGGYLRSLRIEGKGVPVSEMDWTDQVGNAGRVIGFGVDGSGEVYVTTTASLFKLVANR